MCGVCGTLRLPGGPDVDPELIARMSDTMIHRGPDDSGVYISPDRKVGMGHRRLSIIDLSPAGRGPMPNEDGTVWISYNGEVYNHAALRTSLLQAGHRYRSQTDTETLIHLYEERGISMLDDLRGMFAFSLWDQKRSRLFIARDRVGIKPLYYTIAGGLLLWASEIKALLAHPAVSPNLDEGALLHYLTFAVAPSPMTLFAGIRKLAPSELLVVEDGKDIEIRRWWTPAGHPMPDDVDVANEAAVAKYLRQLITDAVTERIMSDVPHGVLLSGGVDSSLILAILSAHLNAPVQTFSIGFEQQAHFDERVYASRVAKQFGANHHELILEPERVIDLMPELVYGQDEPASDWTCLPQQLLARFVRDCGVTVVQVGEGSDELFAGYPRYRRYAALNRGIWGQYMKLPKVVRSLFGAIVPPVLPSWDHLREPRDLFRRAARDEPLFLSGAVVNWESEKVRLLTPRLRARLLNGGSSSVLVMQNLARFRREAPNGDFTAAMAYQDFMVRLPELLLMRVDKMTMLSSVEARVPFLDHRVVQFGTALPEALKLGGGRTKHILKLAAEPLLDAEVLDRPKKGFDVPLSAWLRSEPLAGWAEHVVLDSRLMRRDIFDLPYVNRLFQEHRAGRADHGFRLWNLVNLCSWADRWIEGATP